MLACLAVSMTAGTLLLSWMEPTPNQATTHRTLEQYLKQARAAISSSRELSPIWKGITIVSLSEPVQSAALTAVAPQHNVHFIVDSAGNVVAYHSWRRQAPVDLAHRIHIGLRTSSATGPPPQAQLISLKTLLEEINRAVVPHASSARLPIALDDGSQNSSRVQAIRSALRGKTGRS